MKIDTAKEAEQALETLAHDKKIRQKVRVQKLMEMSRYAEQLACAVNLFEIE